MHNFTYAISTRVYFGEGQLKNLAKNVVKYSSKLLIVCGIKSVTENGILDAVTRHLDENSIEYLIMRGVEPNAKLAQVKEGVRLCRENNLDGVLAVGGGSTLDCAKAIAGCASYDGDIWDLISKKLKYTEVLPIFTVLTLSAAGSEMDALAVITDPGRREKLITGSPMMLPKVSIEDPTYTYTVPKYHIAAGIVDMFSHILEPYFDTDETPFVSDRIAEALLKTIFRYAPIILEDPSNYEAASNLMWTSSMAVNTLTAKGKNIGWSVHEIEHTVSAYYDITHGVGLAVLTPAWMDYVLNETTCRKFATYGKNVFGIDPALPDMEIAAQAIAETRRFLKFLGMPATLREAGIPDDTYFDEMAVKAFGPEGRQDSFIPLSVEDVRNILANCF